MVNVLWCLVVNSPILLDLISHKDETRTFTFAAKTSVLICKMATQTTGWEW